MLKPLHRCGGEEVGLLVRNEMYFGTETFVCMYYAQAHTCSGSDAVIRHMISRTDHGESSCNRRFQY